MTYIGGIIVYIKIIKNKTWTIECKKNNKTLKLSNCKYCVHYGEINNDYLRCNYDPYFRVWHSISNHEIR